MNRSGALFAIFIGISLAIVVVLIAASLTIISVNILFDRTIIELSWASVCALAWIKFIIGGVLSGIVKISHYQ